MSKGARGGGTGLSLKSGKEGRSVEVLEEEREGGMEDGGRVNERD